LWAPPSDYASYIPRKVSNIIVNHAATTIRNGATVQKAAIFGLKFAITAACFWYVFHQIKLEELLRTADNLNFGWIAFATFILMFQVPLAGWRWSKITNALEPDGTMVPLGSMIAITAISVFLGQIVPNLMSEGIRVWLFSRIRRGWRRGIGSVLIDRGVGVGTLVAVGFVTLLFPSALTALGGYRLLALFAFAGALAGGIAGLVFAPLYVPMLIRLRMTSWIGELIAASRLVLIGSGAAFSIVGIALGIHTLSIIGIWSLGRAFAMTLSVVDASLLFTLMVAIAILPISVGGWGLRELAVTTFLGAQGFPVQQAFLFSVTFGLILIAASLPGALIMIFYSPGQIQGNPASPS
jgi:uncharacterized membrane protein YbhN (UPF0104 family)